MRDDITPDTSPDAAPGTGPDTTAHVSPDTASDTSTGPLEPGDETDFRTRWRDVQALFVDDPREAVHAADDLVREVTDRLAATFAERRRALEAQWQRGEDTDTEGLRTVLRQYRSFFDRLLSAGGESGPDPATGTAPNG